MKILHTLQSFHPETDDTAQQALELSRNLQRNGATPSLLTTRTPADADLPTRETVDGIPLRRVKSGGGENGYGFCLDAATQLGRFDLVHSHSYRTFLTDCAFFLPG